MFHELGPAFLIGDVMSFARTAATGKFMLFGGKAASNRMPKRL
jgi:hypothetical protein